MTAMTRDGDSNAARAPESARPTPAFATGLLWAGPVACVLGLGLHRMWEAWRPGRFGELLLLALAVAGLGWIVRKALRWSQAGAQAAVLLAALIVFAGPLPVLATMLLALAALALGGLFARDAPLGLGSTCGMVLIAGLLGWLLPLSLHTRWSYLALCVACIAWRHRDVRACAARLRDSWRSLVTATPRAAAWGVLALGLAASATWLPTLQADDLGYHLRLPWELRQHARYVPDPWLHVWALAPWMSDVLQAFVQLLSGREARGALNALWIIVTASGVWHLCRALGGDAKQGWIAVALYASLPLTAALAGGMQTETAATALLVWLAWLVCDRRDDASPTRLWICAVLVGGLFALKPIAGLQGMVLVAWACSRLRWPAPGKVAAATAMAIVVAGSSYVYAAVVAGNPVLPLFNAWFQSPYFAASNFDDLRWHAGWSPLLPWNLTFRSAEYHEAFAGAAGFVLVALAGAWLLAIWHRPTRALALASAVMLALTLLPLQYLRYGFPPMVIVLPALVLATIRVAPRHGLRLLVAVCVLNFAFQANAQWMLRTGALKLAVLHPADARPLFEKYAPVRLAIAALRRQPHEQVLLIDDDAPWIAELGSAGRSTSWYAPAWQRRRDLAERDASGSAWMQLWRESRISHVLLHAERMTAAQREALRRMAAQPQGRYGGLDLWRIPLENAP